MHKEGPTERIIADPNVWEMSQMPADAMKIYMDRQTYGFGAVWKEAAQEMKWNVRPFT